ncbi:MAG: hypothetical protein AB7E79_01285 [Rhodospirillaceae bacterium]
MATRYRRRPIEIQAFQWNGQPRAEWPEWLEAVLLADGRLAIGGVRDKVYKGDWLVREAGTTYRLPPALFDAAYERIDTAD